MKLRLSLLFLLVAVLPVHAQQSTNDLIGGSDRPEASRVTSGKTVYFYPKYLVFSVDHEAVGADITICRRTAGIKMNAPATWENLSVIFSLKKEDEANYFSGIAEDALLVDLGTSPDRVLKIFDIKSGRKVFDHDYRAETAKVMNGRYLEVQRQVKRDIAKLSRSQAEKFPKIADWLATGGSAAWFEKVIVDLKTFSEKRVGEPELLMKQ